MEVFKFERPLLAYDQGSGNGLAFLIPSEGSIFRTFKLPGHHEYFIELIRKDGEIGKIFHDVTGVPLQSNFEELSTFFLSHGQTELYPAETIGLIRECSKNPCIYLGMNNGLQDVEGIMLFGSDYKNISPVPTEKDFFVAPLYLPDLSGQTKEGHFVTGIFRKTSNRRLPYELYIFDSNGFKGGNVNLGREGYLSSGREIAVPAKTLNECNLQMNSDTYPYYTLVSCSILSNFDDFESLKQYCAEQQQRFIEEDTNDIDQEVMGFLLSHGMTSDIFLNFKVNGPSFHLPGTAGKANISCLHLGSLKGIEAKTTNDIIKKSNQQTYIARLRQQRKRSNSMPNKPRTIFD